MDVRTATPVHEPHEPAARPGSAPHPGTRTIIRLSAGVASAILLLLAIGQPVWEARLSAPQYPQGLRLSAFGGRVEGDIDEITDLNHYVGMRPYDPEDLPEMALWVPTLIVAIGAVGLSTFGGRKWWARLARLFLWTLPLGVLAVIQFRLYQYGHHLTTDPRPALPLDPFTPWVVGRTHVINFTTISFPGLALVLIWAAAAIQSFVPGLPNTVRRVAGWMRQPVGREDAGTVGAGAGG